jgi:acyl-coenzyme A synthetase/AMP-(fatty) acid ligase
MNGFRIELDEISQVILKNEMLADAICVGLSRNNEVKKIIAFIILKEPVNQIEIIPQIKLNLQNNLPYYMMPGDFVFVDSFPVNVSHKVDKNKLIADYLKVQLGE